MRTRSLPGVVGSIVVLVLLLVVSSRPMGVLPPLGPFLDPANGIWAVARTANLPRSHTAPVPGLTGTVRIRYDRRAVPHIFASTPEDAYRALGYVVARDRLFQLEIQTRATAGTLTELLGPALLDADRSARAIGLSWSADREFALIDSASEAGRALAAYAAGVNAWIDGMTRADLPIEYRLLNRMPVRWEPRYTLYLLKRMGWTLARESDELSRLRAASLVGPDAAESIFPINSPIQEPIVPGAGRFPRYDWPRIAPPVTSTGRRADGPTGRRAELRLPDGQALKDSLTVAGRRADLPGGQAGRRPVELLTAGPPGRRAAGEGLGVGSNSWAVSPRRARNGYALLAGDPHLELTLPSIWYEVHLQAVGRSGGRAVDDSSSAELDAYGVTIPGVPGVVIGFNRDVAWTFTNTEADVMDQYTETVDDAAHPEKYLVNGVWQPLEWRIESFRDPQGNVLATDTIYHTHRGPMVIGGGHAVSVRWTVLEDSAATVLALIKAQRARSVDDWLAAMEHYEAPAQNGLVADRAGHIAFRASGRFPYRPGDGRGTVIRDGSASASDWIGNWPVSRYPLVRDPAQGFIATANQQPLDPRVDPTYLSADWLPPWRALRINQLLRADSAVTPDAMRQYQTDPGSPRADLFVGAFLAARRSGGPAVGTTRRSGGQAVSDSVSDSATKLERATTLLAEWDRRYTKNNTRAVLFEAAMEELAARTWDELETHLADRPLAGAAVRPNSMVLAALLQDPGNEWWDDRRTPEEHEDRDAILRASLAAAYDRVIRERGDPAGAGWRWDHVRHANLYHLLRLPGFSVLGVPVQGGPSTINPSSGDGTNGTSWRMVVELGPELRAWGTYPGGQSGNPASSRYLDRLPRWIEGRLDTLFVPRHERDPALGGTLSLLTLEPRR